MFIYSFLDSVKNKKNYRLPYKNQEFTLARCMKSEDITLPAISQGMFTRSSFVFAVFELKFFLIFLYIMLYNI